MFFPERIKNIKVGDKVLEIGPGATPHPRSDVLLERKYSNKAEYDRQCGGHSVIGFDSRTIFYDGELFPFSDSEFDYVICSHVIEHVEEVEMFCAEMFRVAKSGYIEYPLFYYEYVFDIPEHVNVLKKNDEALVYLKKSEVLSDELKVVREFWFNALSAGYTETVSHLLPSLMEGFEWLTPFEIHRANSVSELFHATSKVPLKPQQTQPIIRNLLNKLMLAWLRETK